MLAPTRQRPLQPGRCRCGHSDFKGRRFEPFYTHQQIELPGIKMDVTHWILQQCQCPACGKTVKARLPEEARFGCGPRLSALIAELSGIKAMSRKDVQQLIEDWEGILSLKETCRLRTLSTFQVLENCLRSYFSNTTPDMSWI